MQSLLTVKPAELTLPLQNPNKQQMFPFGLIHAALNVINVARAVSYTCQGLVQGTDLPWAVSLSLSPLCFQTYMQS